MVNSPYTFHYDVNKSTRSLAPRSRMFFPIRNNFIYFFYFGLIEVLSKVSTRDAPSPFQIPIEEGLSKYGSNNLNPT